MDPVGKVFKFLIYNTRRNSYYQFYAVQNASNRCVMFHMMMEHNHDLYCCVTELHGCGRGNW